MAAICTIVIILRRKAPFLLVGWLWYLVMLLPVVGLIQVGNQARADRYTYLPQIGLWIAIAWSAAGIAESRARLGRHFGAAGGAAGAILAILAIVAWRQTSFWRDSETLWRHTIRCTGRNPVAHYNFGEALSARGRIDEAVAEYRRAIDEKPDYPEACYNLGVLLVERGEIDEAVRQYRAALRAAPDLSEAHCNLGAILADRGFYDEAIEHYRAALKIMPDFAEVHNNLGNVELRLGRVAEAVSHYEEALRVMPDYADAHGNLGVALLGCGRFDAAIVHFRQRVGPSARQRERPPQFGGGPSRFAGKPVRISLYPNPTPRQGLANVRGQSHFRRTKIGTVPRLLPTVRRSAACIVRSFFVS